MTATRRGRTGLYCGPLANAERRELPGYELHDRYVAERKKDGMWVAMHVGGRAGLARGPHRFESRTGLDCEGADVEGLVDVDMGIVPVRTILVGELEAASPAATASFRRLGFRRLHLYDVIAQGGVDMRDLPYGERTGYLRATLRHLIPPRSRDRVLLVEQRASGFVAFYDQVVREGDEGLVLKPLDVSARPSRADGKTPEWVRVKPYRTVDYVVVGPAWTESKELSAKLGLYIGGRLRTVLQYPLPDLELTPDGEHLVQEGRVVELYGRELFPSGALRHAQFRRWREDKPAEDCVGEPTMLEGL